MAFAGVGKNPQTNSATHPTPCWPPPAEPTHPNPSYLMKTNWPPSWSLRQTANAAANGTLLFHDMAPPAGAVYYRARETPKRAA